MTIEDEMLQHLGRLMSDVSEDCWSAGWLRGTEEIVPMLARESVNACMPTYWGEGKISVDLARRLCRIADWLGCWVRVADEDGELEYVRHIPECDK